MLEDTLDEMAAFIGTYVDIPTEYRDVVALWCMYTHCFPKQEFSTVPYVLITSAEKASGKSTLLDTAAKLVRSPLMSASMSPAMIGRSVDGHTLMLDELDTVYSRKSDESGKEMAAVLNGGFHRNGSYDRLVLDRKGNYQPQSFKTFGPKMLVGIAAEYPEALVSRCVHIQIERMDNGSKVQRARERIMTEQSLPILQCAILDAAAIGVLPFVDDMPDASGRTLDVWEPLFSLANAASQKWTLRALTAFSALQNVTVEPTTPQRLLRDCRTVFDAAGVDYLRTLVLIKSLEDLGEGWETYAFGKPISPQALGRQLAKYGIHPERAPDLSRRAIYTRASFEGAWKRYA